MGELGPRERKRCGMRTRRRAAPYPESPSNSTSTRRSMPLPDLRARARRTVGVARMQSGCRAVAGSLRGHGRGARTGCEASREAPRGRRAPCEPSSRPAPTPSWHRRRGPPTCTTFAPFFTVKSWWRVVISRGPRAFFSRILAGASSQLDWHYLACEREIAGKWMTVQNRASERGRSLHSLAGAVCVWERSIWAHCEIARSTATSCNPRFCTDRPEVAHRARFRGAIVTSRPT